MVGSMMSPSGKRPQDKHYTLKNNLAPLRQGQPKGTRGPSRLF